MVKIKKVYKNSRFILFYDLTILFDLAETYINSNRSLDYCGSQGTSSFHSSRSNGSDSINENLGEFLTICRL